MNAEYVESSYTCNAGSNGVIFGECELVSGQADTMASVRARTVLVRIHKDSKLTLFFFPISQQTPPCDAKSLV